MRGAGRTLSLGAVFRSGEFAGGDLLSELEEVGGGLAGLFFVSLAGPGFDVVAETDELGGEVVTAFADFLGKGVALLSGSLSLKGLEPVALDLSGGHDEG